MKFLEARSTEDLKRAFAVLRELRTTLEWEEFLHVLEVGGRENGYTALLVEDSEGRAIGMMGYRFITDIMHGFHLYVDDLCVSSAVRSQGIGAKLLARGEEIARARGCRGLRLCTGVANEAGKRFYEREGWAATAYAFKKKL